MKILTKRQINSVAKDVARMQIMIISHRAEIGDDMSRELTTFFRELVEKTGGEYGIGKYSDKIADYFLNPDKKAEKQELAKVIKIG